MLKFLTMELEYGLGMSHVLVVRCAHIVNVKILGITQNSLQASMRLKVFLTKFLK